MDELNVSDTRTSLVDQVSNGNGILPSEPDAVAHCLTRLANEYSQNSSQTQEHTIEVNAEALASLILMVVNLQGYIWNPDKTWLAMDDAKREARRMGIPDSVFKEVAEVTTKYGKLQAAKHPCAILFGNERTIGILGADPKERT